MGEDLVAKASTTINAPVEEVWKALIDPELIKQYFFGVDVVSDWQVGSSFPAFAGLLAEFIAGFVVGYLVGIVIHRPAKQKP